MDTVKQYRQNGFKVRVTHYRLTVGGEMIQYSRKTKCGTIMQHNGGYTIVEVRDPAGTEVSGCAKCSVHDKFNYTVGTNIALGRALKQLEEQEQGE